MADYALGTTIRIFFTTRSFSTGVPTQLAGTPVLKVIEEDNATPITSGVSVDVDRASVTGLNQATIVATSGNGYENGKDYAVYISTGTVGGVSVVGEVVGHFSIGKQAAAVWEEVLETGFTADRLLRIVAAAAAGKVSGGPGSPVFRNVADTQDQVTGTADSSGNRTAASYGS